MTAHFLVIHEDYKMDKLARNHDNEIVARPWCLYLLYLTEIAELHCYFGKHHMGTRLDISTAYHPQTDGQSERTIQTLEDMLRECVTDFGGSWGTHLPLTESPYNNSYRTSIKCASFEANRHRGKIS